MIITCLQICESITAVGNNFLCVNSKGSYGVLYITDTDEIVCSTCKYNKSDCAHKSHLASFCNDYVKAELPDSLQRYSELLFHDSSPRSIKKYPDYSCLSKQEIPFKLTSELSKILQIPFEERVSYSKIEDMAHLRPDTIVSCECDQGEW